MIKQTVNGLERSVYFEKGWDKRNPNPAKDYGIKSVGIKFLVKGAKGAIQFYLYSGWYPNNNAKGTYDSVLTDRAMAADLGYHAYEPQYEGQTMISDKCPYLDDKPCYYDGSGLQAEEPFRILVSEGDEALWKFLEGEYERRFGED